MRRIKRIHPFLFAVLLLTTAGIIACNNSGKKLVDAINEGHNSGMARMGQLTRAQQETIRLLDSIARLPVAAREAAAPYQARLESLLQELNDADLSMNKWMNEYKWDSTFTSVRKKVGYLRVEKEKVTRVKEAIVNSLQKADSVLQQKF